MNDNKEILNLLESTVREYDIPIRKNSNSIELYPRELLHMLNKHRFKATNLTIALLIFIRGTNHYTEKNASKKITIRLNTNNKCKRKICRQMKKRLGSTVELDRGTIVLSGKAYDNALYYGKQTNIMIKGLEYKLP